MSDHETLPPFYEASWQERAEEFLPLGGRCQWDYGNLVDLTIGLGCRLQLSPVVRFRRFSKSAEIIVGAKVQFCMADGQPEGICLLHADEIRAILECCRPDGLFCERQLELKSFELGTRGGLQILWSTASVLGDSITLKFPRSRDALLTSDMFRAFLAGLRECLVVVRDRDF